MTRYCEKCRTPLATTSRFCGHCGASIAPAQEPGRPAVGPPAQTPCAASATPYTEPPIFYKNPGISTLLSFFFMGAGQIYNGEIGKGIAFLITYAFSLLLMFVVIGFITTPILWIWGMIDANGSAKRVNEQLAREQGRRPI